MKKENLVSESLRPGGTAINVVTRLTVRCRGEGDGLALTASKRPLLIVTGSGSQVAVFDMDGKKVSPERLAGEDPELAEFLERCLATFRAEGSGAGGPDD